MFTNSMINQEYVNNYSHLYTINDLCNNSEQFQHAGDDMKKAEDISAEGYIPEGFVVVENFMDIVNLGEEKIKKLIAYWIDAENKRRKIMRSVEDNHSCDSHFWHCWKGDARWGKDNKRKTFLRENLSPDERALYENTEKEIYSIETKLSNLQTLLEVAQKLAKSKPRKK